MDYKQARANFRESLELQGQLKLRASVATSLCGIAVVDADEGHFGRAAVLMAAVNAFCDEFNIPDPRREEEIPAFDALLCANLGEAALAAFRKDGQRMQVEEAIEFARGTVSSPTGSRSTEGGE